MASSRKLQLQILALAILIAAQFTCVIIFGRAVLRDLDPQDTLWQITPKLAVAICLVLSIVVEVLLLRALYERRP